MENNRRIIEEFLSHARREGKSRSISIKLSSKLYISLNLGLTLQSVRDTGDAIASTSGTGQAGQRREGKSLPISRNFVQLLYCY